MNKSYTGLRMELLQHVSYDCNKVVLDVGCSTGVNGKYLLDKKMAKEVYGIEYNSEMAQNARENGIKIIEGDLNNPQFLKEALQELPQFDVIIFGDILEHLFSPENVLFDLVNKLKSDGQVLISLPNISHIELFIQVYIKGTWPKNTRGIFDKTHLRWFTKKDAFNLVEYCGLFVEKYEPKLRARDAIGSEFNWKFNLLKIINREWVTFQHILICKNGR